MLEKILNFIIEYKDIIIVLIGFIIWIISNKKEFDKRVLNGILTAKQLAKEKILTTGKSQEDFVVENILKFVGKRFSFVKYFKEDTLRNITKILYTKALDLYDDGKLNDSFGSK